MNIIFLIVVYFEIIYLQGAIGVDLFRQLTFSNASHFIVLTEKRSGY